MTSFSASRTALPTRTLAVFLSLPLTGARVQTAVYFVFQTLDRGVGDCGQSAPAAQVARQFLQPALSR